LRRDWWHLDFLTQIEGVGLRQNPGPKFAGTEEQPPMPIVTGKLRYAKPIMVDDFLFLKSNTKKQRRSPYRLPSMLHYAAGARRSLTLTWKNSGATRPRSTARRSRLSRRQAAPISRWTTSPSPISATRKIRANCVKNGDDPEKLPATYSQTIKESLRDKPRDMVVAMHTCRGNFKSAWVAEGGYEPVAEAMFASGVDAFFMEFDSARAGGFEPLRFLPKGKKVVLGLVPRKLPGWSRKRS
jgi:5-methyltetrahydropteroyltriglutamate--homocysteine methyltransferase